MAMTAASMASYIQSRLNAASLTQVSGTVSNPSAAQLQTLTAFCQGIIDEILANSELVPVTSDGDGAIMTGKVK